MMQILKPTLFLFSQLILLLCGINFATAGEPSSNPMLRFDLGEHSAAISRIAVDDSDRFLVTASNDKTARVWSLSDGRLLSTLRIPISIGDDGRVNAVALSPDGNTVALGGRTGYSWDKSISIYLFDRSTGRLLRRLKGMPNVISHLDFSPDGSVLAVGMGGHDGIRLYSVADGRVLAEDRDYGDASYSVRFSHDGRLVATSFDGFLRLYRWDGQQLTLMAKRVAPGGAQPYAARFSPDGTCIAVGFGDSHAVNVLNGSDLSLQYAPDTSGVNGSLFNMAWSADGQTLYATGWATVQLNGQSQRYIRRWEQGGRGSADNIPVESSTLKDLVALSDGRLVFGSAAPSWGILNQQGVRIVFHAPSIADTTGSWHGFMLSDDGAQVRFGYERYGKSPAVFDSRSHLLLPDSNVGLFPPKLTSPGLAVIDWENSSAPKLNGSPIKLYQSEIARSLALLPDGSGFVLGAQWTLRLFDRNGNQRWQQSAPEEVWAVNVSQDGRWVVAAYGDGTIRWHRASDGAEQMAFFPHVDRERWVLWTPSGYYDAALGAEDLIGWHLNNGKDNAADFFPASRFRERFYRPDVLAKVFETQDEARAVQLANVESGRRTQTVTSVAQVLPPVVEIVSPASESSVQSGKITVRYIVRTAADAPVTAMRVRVNGLLQSDMRALRLVKANNDTQEIEVAIPEQNAEVQLFAENKYSTSTPAILRLKWAGKTVAKQAMPKLYVLAVGVSKYANPEYNLGLAAKDANDFVRALQGQKGRLYSDVVVKLLTDTQATKDDVLDGLDWLKQNVTANDVGMMFIAGHGMNDKVGGYYFMPHNADPDKLARTGVSQSDIKQTFANLSGHTVFFIDTCYSGGVMGNVRTSGFVNDLASAENGAVVFTASSAGQLSQENPDWGNGAFTKSVVEGINGNADFRKSGFVTVKGLDYYVDDRVKVLTHGQQTPVSISPGGVSDFPIASVGK